MPTPAAPFPSYVAEIRPFPPHHPALRRIRLTQGQAATLAALTVPIVIDGTSRVSPCAQAEVALQAAVSAALDGREVCVALYRWTYGGELWVKCGGKFIHVATVELTPARMAVAA